MVKYCVSHVLFGFMGAMCAAELLAQRATITPSSGGAPLSGRITAVSATHIELESTGGVTRRLAVNEVERIIFTDAPTDVRNALNRYWDGQYEEAAAVLGRVPPETISDPVIRQDLEFYRAASLARAALRGSGDKAAAARALVDFVGAHANSFHHYDAVQLVGDLAYVMGRYDVAANYYGRLAQAPWPDYQMRAKVLTAQALVAQQKFTEALAQYDEVLAMPGDTAHAARQKLFAQIGKAVCVAEQGQADQGRQMVEAIIRDNDAQDAELFARAYNALGVCYMKLGQVQDALLAFLHVDLLFSSQADAHAEALYYLSDLWGKVGRSDRATAARSLLKSRYAGSIWANK